MSYHDRPYRDENDYRHMRRLVRAIYAAQGPPVYCTIGDLEWWRYTNPDPNAIQSVHLWFTTENELVAFAWPSDNQVDLIVHPDHDDLNSHLLAWVKTHLHSRQVTDDTPGLFRAWSYTCDTLRVKTLQQYGYRRTDNCFVYLTRRLDERITEPAIPPGYSIRHVQGAADLEERVAVHRAAFAPSKMSDTKYRAVMEATTYRTDLDLVMCAPEGGFAAFALVWYDEANRLGTFEPVGCHPDHRRLGLARALLHAGMRQLQELGAQMAQVFSSGANVAAAQLYRNAGFTEIDRIYAWENPCKE